VQLPNDERASTEQSPKIFPPNASISKRNFLPAWLAVIAVLGIAIVLLVGRLAFRAQVTPAPTVISTNMPQPSQPATTEISPYITPSDFGTPNVVNINTVLLPAITSTVPSVISQPEEPKTGATVISSSDGMAVVYIPAGDFFMGASAGDSEAGKDEFPQHIVYLDAFWVDKFEVTNAMFADFVQNTNYRTRAEIDGWSWEFDGQWLKPKGTNWRHPMDANSNLDGLDNHPVVRISHADAEAYCKWAGRRLLTEAEWEKAARGENGLAYPWSNQYSCGNANFGDSGCDSYLQTAPVGSYLDGASPYGVLDMAGNVWEWVADWYQEDYYKNTPYKNPLGPNSGDGFVMRGGSWSSDNRRWFRASWREWGYENDSYWSTGFRCGSSDAP
jgi:serine/threonine-protein kinase